MCKVSRKEKFITTEFTYGRHEARVNMIMEAEK